MDKKLDFLTKALVDQAVTEINKNGIPPKREGKGYAVSIGEEKYPFKLIVTEAAKIAGTDLTSKDFSSSETNRNGFQKITGYTIIDLGVEIEYSKFKKLLEYFVSHLEWVVTEDVNNRGYNEFIKPLIVKNVFKRTGQGYAEAQIQQQIKEWEQYENGKICINIQPNFGSYKSSKTYLNWLGTGLNIIVNWNGNQISSLYQEEYLYWEKNPRRIRFGNEVSVEKLDLFNLTNHVSETLIEFYETFNAAIIRYNKSEKLKKMKLAIDTSVKLLDYKKQIILQGPPGTGKTREAKSIAKEMLGLADINDLKDNDQFKLIQFHPSYTYEDFVRGIIAESKGDKIEYKNVNKTLGLFAEKALKNFQNSKKVPELISKEIWVEENYLKFKDNLESILEKSGELLIKENTKPKITAIEDDAVRVNRYSNENDSVLIKDSDIINGYIGLFLVEPVVRVKDNFLLSKSARSGMYYLYQNLIEKFKEYLEKEKLTFELTNDFKQEELQKYILVIDEINRANLSTVLGELIYALEYRGEAVESIYNVDGNALILPPNLYIIGTMNTADRSVGHIDYAIRRRFAFVDVLPKDLSEEEGITFDSILFSEVAQLFKTNLSAEFEKKDVQLGHSYFIDKSDEQDGVAMTIRLEYEIKPILLEYVKDGVLIGDNIKHKIKDLKTSI